MSFLFLGRRAGGDGEDETGCGFARFFFGCLGRGLALLSPELYDRVHNHILVLVPPHVAALCSSCPLLAACTRTLLEATLRRQSIPRLPGQAQEIGSLVLLLAAGVPRGPLVTDVALHPRPCARPSRFAFRTLRLAFAGPVLEIRGCRNSCNLKLLYVLAEILPLPFWQRIAGFSFFRSVCVESLLLESSLEIAVFVTQQSGSRLHIPAEIWTQITRTCSNLDADCTYLQQSGRRLHIPAATWTQTARTYCNLDGHRLHTPEKRGCHALPQRDLRLSISNSSFIILYI